MYSYIAYNVRILLLFTLNRKYYCFFFTYGKCMSRIFFSFLNSLNYLWHENQHLLHWKQKVEIGSMCFFIEPVCSVVKLRNLQPISMYVLVKGKDYTIYILLKNGDKIARNLELITREESETTRESNFSVFIRVMYWILYGDKAEKFLRRVVITLFWPARNWFSTVVNFFKPTRMLYEYLDLIWCSKNSIPLKFKSRLSNVKL